MKELLSRYRYLLERSPYGGGACLIDSQQALLWIYTSSDPSAQLARQVTHQQLRRRGSEILSELAAEAYEAMIGPDAGLGTMVTGQSQTGETISIQTGDIVAEDVVEEGREVSRGREVVGDDLMDILTTTPMQRPNFEEDKLDEPETQVLAIDPRALQSEFATQRFEVTPELLARASAPDPEPEPSPSPESNVATMTLERDARLLIEQLNPSLGALPRPAHIEQVDDDSVMITVAATRDVRAFSRVVDLSDFEQNATHVVSEVLRAAQNRAKLARARQKP